MARIIGKPNTIESDSLDDALCLAASWLDGRRVDDIIRFADIHKREIEYYDPKHSSLAEIDKIVKKCHALKKSIHKFTKPYLT